MLHFINPLFRCFRKANFQLTCRVSKRADLQENPLTPELKRKASESLEILEAAGFISGLNSKYIRNLVTVMQGSFYKYGLESRRLGGNLQESRTEKIQPPELLAAVQDLIQIAVKGPGRKRPTTTEALLNFYNLALSAEKTATEKLIEDFYVTPAEDQKPAALKLAGLIRAEVIPIRLMKELLEHVDAPLSARRHKAYLPIHYSAEMMAMTLASKNFQKSSASGISGLSEHARRAVYLIAERRYDSYDPEAINQLVYGLGGKDSHGKTEPDYAVIAAILIFKPEIITDNKLHDLCAENLPFSAEENKQLVKNLTRQKSQINPDSLIGDIFSRPVFFSHLTAAERYLGAEFNPEKLLKIVILANFILRHREDR